MYSFCIVDCTDSCILLIGSNGTDVKYEDLVLAVLPFACASDSVLVAQGGRVHRHCFVAVNC